MVDATGRFGFHPDPAIDFCCEVDLIEAIAYEVSVGMRDRKELDDHIFQAMQFRVGGDAGCVAAKNRLRGIEVAHA